VRTERTVKKKHKKNRRTRAERRWSRILTLVMTLAALFGAWNILVEKPSMAAPDGAAETPDGPSKGGQGKADKNAPPDAQTRRENVWTFLLVGMDKGGGNTDSILLATYDVDNQSVSLASIARDTRVDVSRKLKKINAAYAFGGMDELKDEVSRTFGIPIDFYVRININGFVALVDAVDGVDFEVPCNMNYDDPAQDLSIHYKKGMRHLTGQQALEVCRFRKNNSGEGYGDEGRMQTQRGVMTEVAKKILAWNNIGRVNDFLAIVKEHVDTDMELSDMTWFATRAVSFSTENLHTMAMPCSWHNPYMYLHPDETLQMVNEYLSPYVLDRTADQLDIITR